MTPIALAPPVALTPEALADLARSCHADSIAAGWWEPLEPAADTAREAMRADLIGSEVGEALDALRRPERPLAYLDDKGKPDGYLVEVADAAIRALDLLGRESLPLRERDLADAAGYAAHRAAAIGKRDYGRRWHHHIWDLVLRLAAEHGVYNRLFILAEIVVDCNAEAAAHGADLVTLINLKRAYNRTRGTRHGGMSV